jgi:hypothetical protein
MASKKICIACNEDGFGPSTFAYYVVRALAELWHNSGSTDVLEIWVLNATAYAFNKSIYANLPEVHLVPLDSHIRLEKEAGEVHVAHSLERFSHYAQYRAEYDQVVQPYLKACQVAVDIGVPLLVRSAQKKGIPTITFFDHSWAATIRGICSEEAHYFSNPTPTDADRRLAEQIATEIESDEARTTEVILFDRYITPPLFRRHWESLGLVPKILLGVLGHREDPQTSRAHLNALLTQLDQQPVLTDTPLVLISPGGTPVWSPLLPEIIDSYITRSEQDYLPILSRPTVDEAYKRKMRASMNIRWFDAVVGSTQQVLLPAFDLVVTRAGGGIINDCLASQVPFVCVEESQWQVQLNESVCKELGLIPDLPETSWKMFEENPVSCIDAFFKTQRVTPRNTIPGGAEYYVAEVIRSML